MSNNGPLPALIDRVYDAGLGALSWGCATEDIRRAVGGEVAAFFFQDCAHGRTTVSECFLAGYPENAKQRYEAHFGQRDVRLPILSSLPAGGVYVDDRAMPFAVVEASEIYHDFYRPIGVAHGMGVMPFKAASRFGVVSVHRARGNGNFRGEEIALFEDLAPHIVRALRLQRQVAQARAVAGGLALALDHFQTAVLLTDQHGLVHELNAAAEALLRQLHCPLRLSARRLSAASPAHDSLIRRSIADASLEGGARPPAVVRIPKTDGSAELGLMVVPARRSEVLGQRGEPLVVIFIADPAKPLQTDWQLLTGQFGLSPTEAQVASLLVAGERIEDIAQARQVSVETVRVQVKSVLAKTEMRGQGQLIGLLSRCLAVLRRIPE